MTWRVNNQEAGQLQFELLLSVLHDSDMMRQILPREVSCTDLLRDTTSLVCLHVRFTQFVENERLSRVYVTHDADNGTAELFIFRTTFLAGIPTRALSTGSRGSSFTTH